MRHSTSKHESSPDWKSCLEDYRVKESITGVGVEELSHGRLWPENGTTDKPRYSNPRYSDILDITIRLLCRLCEPTVKLLYPDIQNIAS
jgi:hypothetical protein